MEFTSELLQFMQNNGNLTIDEAWLLFEKMERKKYLEMHRGKIWHGKDGDWYTKIRMPNGKLKLRHAVSRENLENLIIEHYKTIIEHPTVGVIFEKWIEERSLYEEVKQATLDRMKTDFSKYFGVNGLKSRSIDTINDDILTPFIKAVIHDYDLSYKAWSNVKGVLIGIFSYAKEHKYTTFSISTYLGDLKLARGIYRKTAVRDEDQVFTDEEVNSIISWLTATDDRCSSLTNLGILFDFLTGLRVGELSTLKFSDFNGNVLTVSRTETRYRNPEGAGYLYGIDEATKGRDGYRMLTVPDSALAVLEKIRRINPDGDFLFQYGDHRIIGAAFSKKLYRICGYLGIESRSMHKIRKTYATKLIDSGLLTEKAIINQMGHANSEVTRQHYYFNRTKPEDTLEKVNMIFPEMVTLGNPD